MVHTQDYESVLNLDNVVGVDYDEDEDVVRTFVTKKVPKEDLDETQLVDQNVDRDSDVVEVGEIEIQPQELAEAQGNRKLRHRPVQAGLSEINANSTAATAGPYPAKVVDKSKGQWAGDDLVQEGDLVRLSNNHVYARSDQAEFGEAVCQPSPYDGGTPADEVGQYVGSVPLADGVTVDLAARTAVESDDSARNHHLDPETYDGSVLRENYKTLKGKTLIKTGRTTGVSEGVVRGTSATVRVNYGDAGVITLRDQILTSAMSRGGDSGSPVFDTETGDLVGELFAGSSRVTVIYKASNMEAELGVELYPEDVGGSGNEDGAGSGGGSGDDSGNDSGKKMYVTSLKTTVAIEMEEQNLDLENLSGDKPTAGETVTATATMVGNYPGTGWVDVQGERYEFELAKRDSDSGYSATVDVEVTAPGEYQETFDVDVEGGYVTEE